MTPQSQATMLISRLPFNGVWQGGAYGDEQTHQFQYCSAGASYRSGITMLVTITRNLGWGLAFGDQEWSLQPNQEIPLSMTFDGRNPWSGTARAVNAHLATVPMADNSQLITAFRAAYQMQVFAVGKAFLFNLDGTSRLMVQLVRCVQTQMAIERGEPPPNFAEAPPRTASPAPSPQPPSDASNARIELAAMRIASNLLLQAKLPNARLLSSSETPPALRGHGVVWTSDAGIGAVELVSAQAGKDPQDIASSLINSDANTCKGDFGSGRSSELVDNKVVTKARTACKDSAGARGFRYFIVSGPNGTFIVYELGSGGAEQVPSNDSRLADSVFQAAAVKAAFTP
jgi:hypothetical protein